MFDRDGTFLGGGRLHGRRAAAKQRKLRLEGAPKLSTERWGSFRRAVPVGRFTIPGRPATKKTSPNPIFPGVWGLDLKTPDGRHARGLKDALLAIHLLLRKSRGREAMAKLAKLARSCHPKILPSKAYQRWEKVALEAIRAAALAGLPLPVVPEEHILGVSARFYLGGRQRPDLSGLLEALGDALEAGGVIGNDYWIGSWLRSERLWPPLTSTKAGRAARAEWDPRVDVHLYDLGERLRGD